LSGVFLQDTWVTGLYQTVKVRVSVRVKVSVSVRVRVRVRVREFLGVCWSADLHCTTVRVGIHAGKDWKARRGELS
jgi:hypothetical protein